MCKVVEKYEKQITEAESARNSALDASARAPPHLEMWAGFVKILVGQKARARRRPWKRETQVVRESVLGQTSRFRDINLLTMLHH
jgi:hypothetical protein